MFSMLLRLLRLVVWCLIGLAHLLLALAALVTCWAWQITPSDLIDAYQRMLQTTPSAVLGALGVSGGTLIAGYVWLMRKVNQFAGTNWLVDYLMKDL